MQWEPIPKKVICLVTCSNDYQFHSKMFVAYLIVNGKFYDEPTDKFCLKMIHSEPHDDIVQVSHLCRICKANRIE